MTIGDPIYPVIASASEAIQNPLPEEWIASSLALLAMTALIGCKARAIAENR